ncbi:hypothetical protein [Longimicrobium sp.]|uniref:hypothetical protein n=1 Tax=Longimicrobium sp. TaxID=2029185 RepID=UPI002C080F23|nr:hypothetical protein [Longimicrobium sp.]HSU17772.1 hypothetical protein [Longimicrobium sp.]
MSSHTGRARSSSSAPAEERKGADRKVEQGLTDVVNFFGRMLRTPCDFLFRPRRFRAAVVGTQVGAPPPPLADDYTAPLSYLVVSAAICSIYGYAAATSGAGSQLLLKSPLFHPFVEALTFVWKRVVALKAGEIVLLLTPMALLAVMFSLAFATACRLFRLRHDRSTLLSITAYLFGTYLLLHSLLFSYTLLAGVLWNARSAWWLSACLLAVHVPIGLLVVVAFARYLQLLKAHLGTSARKTMGVTIVALLLFTFCFGPMAFVVFPLVVRL